MRVHADARRAGLRHGPVVQGGEVVTGGMPNEVQARAAADASSDDKRTNERWRQIIPDLKVTHRGQVRVYDFKSASFCPTWYGRAERAAPSKKAAVNNRAKVVTGEYRRRAQKIDRLSS